MNVVKSSSTIAIVSESWAEIRFQKIQGNRTLFHGKHGQEFLKEPMGKGMNHSLDGFWGGA